MSLRFSSPIEFKAPSPEGEFEGLLAVFDSVDFGGDAIARGAFSDTLADHRTRGVPVPLLWSHDPATVLGRFTDLREDPKGLRARGQLTLETEDAREKYALLRDRAVTGLSIGYTIPEGGSTWRGGVRILEKIQLHEGSLVAVPMHPDARITSIKSLSDSREFDRALREGRPIQLDPQSRRKSAAILRAAFGDVDDDTTTTAPPARFSEALRWELARAHDLALSSREAQSLALKVWPLLAQHVHIDDERRHRTTGNELLARVQDFAAELESINSLLKGNPQ